MGSIRLPSPHMFRYTPIASPASTLADAITLKRAEKKRARTPPPAPPHPQGRRPQRGPLHRVEEQDLEGELQQGVPASAPLHQARGLLGGFPMGGGRGLGVHGLAGAGAPAPYSPPPP